MKGCVGRSNNWCGDLVLTYPLWLLIVLCPLVWNRMSLLFESRVFVYLPLTKHLHYLIECWKSKYIEIFKCETKGFWIKIKHCNATIRNLHFWKSRNLFDHPLFFDFSNWSVRRIIKGIKPVKHLNSIWSCINVHMSSATALFATLKCSALGWLLSIWFQNY